MDITINRTAKRPSYTIGKLYIDGKYICDTLEDTDRNLSQGMSLQEIQSKKIYGETAIPSGVYHVTLGIVSPKFKDRTWAKPYGGKIPRLLNVPGFDGVLIHPGTTSKDTLGCILVGENRVVGKVINSQNTFHKLMKILTNVDNITLTIK